MSNEIATYSMILSKLSLGKSGTECPTKTQILAINSLIVIDNASTYGANECVKIDDIRKKVETWNYYLTVSPTSMSFGAGGGSKSFTVSSYKRKVLDGVEQSGDTSVSLKSTTISGTGFSLSGTTVSASANEGTSNRTGTVTITQNESNKTATISLSQSGDTISSYGEWTISVSANPTSVSSSGGTSTITASAKRTVYWASGDVTEETGNPTLSTNLGSLSSAASPSTLTLGENTSTSSRTATIKATHGGKSATCTVTQAGAEPTIEYVFTISPWQVNVGASGGTGDIGFTSYKLVNGNQISLGYSIDSSTLPSWATYSNGRFTISSNSSTSSRSANVYFVQSESGKRGYATISQSGDTISSYGEWTISVSANPTSVSSSGGTSTITASAKRTVYWASGDVTEETGNPTLSTNLGSLSSAASPSTLTLGENTSTSSRTATIKATHGGKSATCTVTQAGAEPTIEYVFTISPWQVNVGASGGTGDIGFTSYKLVNGNQISLGYSIDSSTLPSWATYSNGRFTISSNSSTSSRSAKVYFVQSESGKRDYATISQSGYVPPADNYVFTWDDGSTSNVSANFPWDFSTNGTAANIPVVSTKNGSSQSWSVSSKPSWITTSTTSSKVTISASDNSGSARSGKVVLTQSGSGNTLTVNVSQGAKPAENVYVFTITPNTYDASYSNASFIPRTVSTKNGSNIGYSLTSGGTDWVVVSTTGKITVEILKNTTSNTRSTTLVFTQNESGKTQSIKITQSGYTPTYTFNVIPTNLSVTAAETNETLTVNSYKTVLKSDGSETTESLNYEFSSNNSWVAAARTTTNTTYITVAENETTTQRTAKITLTQAESGAQVFTNVIQAGQQVVDNKLTLTSITYSNSTGYLFPSGQKPVEGETVYLGFQIPNTFTWKTSNGLVVNRGTIYAGNIGNIYVRENDRYKLVKSFQLQTGNQTISF